MKTIQEKSFLLKQKLFFSQIKMHHCGLGAKCAEHLKDFWQCQWVNKQFVETTTAVHNQSFQNWSEAINK